MYNVFVVYVVIVVVAYAKAERKLKIEKLNIYIWVFLFRKVNSINDIPDLSFCDAYFYNHRPIPPSQEILNSRRL